MSNIFQTNHELDVYIKSTRNTYVDRKFKGTREEYFKLLENSKTIYVMNIPLHVTEERLWNIFRIAGKIQNVVMGVNNCEEFTGFAFIIFKETSSVDRSITLLNGIKMEGRSIKVDRDIGFTEDRRYGRGQKGQQMKYDFIRKRNK